LESLSIKSDKTLNKIQMDINRKQQVDSSGNQEEPNIDISKEQNLNSFKDNLALGLPILNKTPKPSSRAPLSLQSNLRETPSLSD
jgi:hypothetical protein